MPYLSTSPQRGRAGIGLRGFARILLVSWLFTLLVCFYSDSHLTPTDVIKDTPVAHEQNGLEHSDSAQDADALLHHHAKPAHFLQDGRHQGTPAKPCICIASLYFYFSIRSAGHSRSLLYLHGSTGQTTPYINCQRTLAQRPSPLNTSLPD